MIWESGGGAGLEERPLDRDFDEVEWNRLERLRAQAPDDDADDFEDFDEEDFDDDFDDDFEEEHDEEYEAENEEYPDDDFGTGADVEEDIGEIEGDIEGDFDEAIPAVDPEAEEGEIAEDEDVPEGD